MLAEEDKPYLIYSGKCLDALKAMEDRCVDRVITDPPYRGFEGMESESAYLDWFGAHFREMKRVCRTEQGISVSQPPLRIGSFQQHFNFQSVVKLDNAMEDSRGDDAYFLCQTSLEQSALPEPSKWPSDVVPRSIHPNDRNIEKMSIIVKAMSNPGDLVLDPFCGSGAIGVACILLGREYIGIELIKARADDASNRIKAAQLHAESNTG